jgi:hypothetical protein
MEFGRPGVAPDQVDRDSGPSLISHPTIQPPPSWFGYTPDPIVGPNWIGVAGSNWPDTGRWAKCFQYIPGRAYRKESSAMRNLLSGLNARFDGIDAGDARWQVDHVRDLQFGGKDRFDNVWPFDASGNMSAGPLHQRQVEAYDKVLGASAKGRWFRIASIGLDPEKARKLGP